MIAYKIGFKTPARIFVWIPKNHNIFPMVAIKISAHGLATTPTNGAWTTFVIKSKKFPKWVAENPTLTRKINVNIIIDKIVGDNDSDTIVGTLSGILTVIFASVNTQYNLATTYPIISAANSPAPPV